jgi:hypothetical protein
MYIKLFAEFYLYKIIQWSINWILIIIYFKYINIFYGENVNKLIKLK